MAYPTPQVQTYEAGLLIGNLQVPALPGLSGGMDEALIFPPIIGNFWHFQYAVGLQMPTVDCQLVLRDNANECFALNFLSYFMNRSNDVSNDTYVIPGGITFYDGADTYLLGGAKADSFSLSAAKLSGEMVNFSCHFCGTSWLPVSAPSLSAFSADPPLMFSNVTFGTGLNNVGIWRLGMTFSNNHHPDGELDGNTTPAAWNAGMMTGSMNLEVRALDGVNTLRNGAAQFSVTGNNVSRTFTMANAHCTNWRRRAVAAPEVMRQYNYDLGSSDGRTTPIVLIS